MPPQNALFRAAALLAAGLATALSPAHAELFDRGSGLVYDSTQDITWLAHPYPAWGAPEDLSDGQRDGQMSWTQATAFAARFTWVDTVRGQTLDDWRLPNADPACGIGYGCRTSEMGHLFYVDFQGTTGYSVTSPFSPGIARSQVLLFQGTVEGQPVELQNGFYWTGQDASRPGEVLAWTHGTNGHQNRVTQISSNNFVLLVRQGDVVSAVPEPGAAALLAAGLATLVGWRRRARV